MTFKTAQKRSARVCLLGASFGTQNFGVNVLTIGTVEILLRAYSNVEISIVDYAREPTTWYLQLRDRNVALPLMNIRFSKKPWQRNHIAFLILLALFTKVVPLQSWRRKLILANPSLRHLNEMDFVAAMSGGDSFSDIYGLLRFVYTSLPMVLALLLGKRLILLPQTIGPFEKHLTRLIARYILRGAEVVYSRDRKGVTDTANLLAGKTVLGKLRFGYDVGFVVDAVRPSDAEWLSSLAYAKERTTLVGVNVSGLLFMGGYTRRNMFRLKTQYDQLVYEILGYLVEQEHCCVLLVPHVLGPEGSEADSAICRKLFEELQPRYGDRLKLVPEGLNEREMKYVIGCCDFFVGARMHACIAALSQAVPTLPVAYSDKFKGVMESTGAEITVADPRTVSLPEILRQTRGAFRKRHETRCQLLRKMPGLREAALNLFLGFKSQTEEKPGNSGAYAASQPR